MKLLLDTHVAIWAVTASERLSPSQRVTLTGADAICVSYCSLWEIAIKSTQGRRALPPISAPEARSLFEGSGFELLEIKLPHIFAVANLPPLHGDPFDRLIVTQALTEPLRLITHDKTLAVYSDTIIVW